MLLPRCWLTQGDLAQFHRGCKLQNIEDNQSSQDARLLTATDTKLGSPNICQSLNVWTAAWLIRLQAFVVLS